MHRFRPYLFSVREPSTRRVLIATFLAPPLAMAAYGTLIPLWFDGGTLSQGILMIMTTVLYGTPIAYAGLLLLGLPAFLLLRKLEAQFGLAYLCLGAGVLPLFFTVRSGLPPSLEHLSLAVVPGLLTAGIWWLLASR